MLVAEKPRDVVFSNRDERKSAPRSSERESALRMSTDAAFALRFAAAAEGFRRASVRSFGS
jgi:hypothetical protein